MKRGERRVLLAVLASGIAILGLTVYLESQYQQHERRIDRVHEEKSRSLAPAPAAEGPGTRLIPRGLTPAMLPDADSRGATLVTLYCVQCHDLPTPLMHSAAEWTPILDRMRRHMASHHSGMMTHVMMPSKKDWEVLSGYVLGHAQIPLDRERLADLDSPEGRHFEATCSQCHAAPMPDQHTAREWPRVVLRMKRHMRNAGKPEPDVEATQQIVDYLQRHAAETTGRTG